MASSRRVQSAVLSSRAPLALLLVVLLLQLALYGCHTGDNQRWELLEDGSLRLFGTNACMDVRSAGTSKLLFVTMYQLS